MEQSEEKEDIKSESLNKGESSAVSPVPEKKKGKKSKIIRNITDGILIVFIAIVALGEMIGLFTRSSNYGVPNVFGHQFMVVLTDSMAKDEDGKEVYPVGDGLVVKKVDLNTIKVGDDISFYWPDIRAIITHRVYQIDYEADTTTLKDFVCHGINTDATNYTPDQHQTVAPKYVLGKVTASSKALGGFIQAMQQWWVILLLIIIPCLVIAASSIHDIIKLHKMTEAQAEAKYNNNKKIKGSDNPVSSTDLLGSLSQEEKQRLKDQMVQEMLDEQKKKKGDQ